MNKNERSNRSSIKNLIKLFILLMISFNFILVDFGKCQEQSNSNPKKIPYLKKDLQSGKVKLFQLSENSKKENGHKTFDKLRIDKELEKFKKISQQHSIYERIYKLQKQAEKEQTLKKETKSFELERIKLFGKPTPFYKAPFVLRKTKNSLLNKVLVSNVLINGKSHDTISINDSFTLTFSFAANYISAAINIYIDSDNNGVVSLNDILLVSEGLVMDNSEYDEDQADGSYRISFDGTSLYSRMESTLIFEVNDYQSISQAIVTVKQKPSEQVILGTISPPLKNIFVEADFNYSSLLYVITDSLGKFKLYVEPGQNQVVLYLFDITGVSNGYLIPDHKTLNISKDTTEVNFILTPASAFIEGYVKDQNGQPIKNIIVNASNNNFQITKTDSTGYYKLGVSEGEYHIYFNNISSDYMQDYNVRKVTILNNSTIQRDIVLLKSNSSISGRVSYNSNGIGGIPVRVSADSIYNYLLSSIDGSYSVPVYNPNSNTIFYNVSVSVPYGYSVTIPAQTGVQPGAININFEIMKVNGGIQGQITDSRTNEPIPNAHIYASGTGDYRSTNSNDSGYYRISLLPGSYTLYVSAESYYSLNTDIFVSTTMVTKNVSLDRSGSFSGSVKDDEGNPINNANITGIDSSGYAVAYGYTNEKGNYQVSGLTTSKYGAFVTVNNYVSQWYNQVYDLGTATFFQVIDGYNTPDINFVLSKGGSISGKVVDKLGNPISGAWVVVYDTLFNYKSYSMTNDTGYYLASGLATGRYYVRASGSEYTEQWYNGATSMDNANKVDVIINENTNDINFILTLGSSISGTVKNRNNVVIKYANIFVYDSTLTYISSASSNDSGYYIVKPLPVNRKLFVYAQYYGYATQWYNNVSTADSATPIILQEGEIRENIDFILSKGGEISGRVLSSTGSPLQNAMITLEKNDGSYAGYGLSNYQGYYSISNIQPGDYYAKAEYYLYEEQYEEQWYNHKTSKSEADLILVKAENTTENINFDLVKINEGYCDSLIITIELANIPDTLSFSQSYVGDYCWEYMWGIRLNADGIDSTGENGCELEVCLLHYKQPGELPFQANIIDGTLKRVIKWEDNYGYDIYSDFPVQISETNKNVLVMSLPTRWSEIKNINDSIKYFSDTYFCASDGIFQDITNMNYGGKKITDPKGDVKYNFIDIVSTSWQIKKPVNVSEVKLLPKYYLLSQNYPNPFNPTTNFEFRIANRGLVSLKVYDILGNEVETIINKELPAGNYKYQWNASGFASGVYLYQLKAGDFVSTKKLILMK